MFAKVASFGVRGIDGFLVHAEADLSAGLPGFSLVGLPDSAVKESRRPGAQRAEKPGILPGR